MAIHSFWVVLRMTALLQARSAAFESGKSVLLCFAMLLARVFKCAIRSSQQWGICSVEPPQAYNVQQWIAVLCL